MLELLIFLGSLLGIAAMVLLNRQLGLSEVAEITSLDDAARRLDTDQIGFQAGQGLLSDDKRAALVEEKGSGRIGLLIASGSDVVIRYLDPGVVKAAKMGEGRDIHLALNDFTFAPIDIAISDTAMARHWADRLNTMQG
ncbi:MAG: hypothetical protein QUV02_01465 [Maricaulis sp.]|jgi:hypothetical protein|uniref:hypothetical protein n=1 Tax=Maricaulis sp. TaxID=1486257 RepID=UPI001B100318|nr:hypothetical protein [Maricaulis sp.]MBO6847365.1 hypothetical protein [Maricaulis sp.]MBO6876435.1 hypothetical protein [Maricaulis sp.]MDM7983090.1 hypothetical protein [Maricaulis sp.]